MLVVDCPEYNPSHSSHFSAFEVHQMRRLRILTAVSGDTPQSDHQPSVTRRGEAHLQDKAARNISSGISPLFSPVYSLFIIPRCVNCCYHHVCKPRIQKAARQHPQSLPVLTFQVDGYLKDHYPRCRKLCASSSGTSHLCPPYQCRYIVTRVPGECKGHE